jgi:hypothetical protein
VQAGLTDVHPVLLDRGERRTGSAFSLDTCSDKKPFVITTRLSFFLLVMSTVVAEIRKAARRRISIRLLFGLL